MAGKKAGRPMGASKKVEVERGFTVVDERGRKVYLSSHPEGISEADAQALSDGLVIESRVVPIDPIEG